MERIELIPGDDIYNFIKEFNELSDEVIVAVKSYDIGTLGLIFYFKPKESVWKKMIMKLKKYLLKFTLTK